MTIQAITLTVKPTSNGQFEIELSPAQFKEPTTAEMPYQCMPGGRRKEKHNPFMF